MFNLFFRLADTEEAQIVSDLGACVLELRGEVISGAARKPVG